MVNDGFGIVSGQLISQETPDIGAVGIKALPLEGWVQDAMERSRIGSGSGHPLPAMLVRCDIAVDQVPQEPASAETPIDVKVLDQKTRANHSHSVVHPTFG